MIQNIPQIQTRFMILIQENETMNEIVITNPREAQYLIQEGFKATEQRILPSLPPRYIFKNTPELRQAMIQNVINSFKI